MLLQKLATIFLSVIRKKIPFFAGWPFWEVKVQITVLYKMYSVQTISILSRKHILVKLHMQTYVNTVSLLVEPEAEFLDEIGTIKTFPPCYSQSPL
jgi:hypothetical protein